LKYFLVTKSNCKTDEVKYPKKYFGDISPLLFVWPVYRLVQIVSDRHYLTLVFVSVHNAVTSRHYDALSKNLLTLLLDFFFMHIRCSWE